MEASNTDSETLSTFNEKKWFDDSDEWSENETESPAGVADTMLTSTEFVEDNERQYILNLAPAEGSRPLSVFRDKFSEEMAYPGIFLGQERPENDKRLTPGHYSEICRSELRRSDRKAAMCVENIFFETKKLQMMNIVFGKSQIALRKCKSNTTALNAGLLKQQEAVETLIHLDEGFKFLRALRGSPPTLRKQREICLQ